MNNKVISIIYWEQCRALMHSYKPTYIKAKLSKLFKLPGHPFRFLRMFHIRSPNKKNLKKKWHFRRKKVAHGLLHINRDCAETMPSNSSWHTAPVWFPGSKPELCRWLWTLPIGCSLPSAENLSALDAPGQLHHQTPSIQLSSSFWPVASLAGALGQFRLQPPDSVSFPEPYEQ